MPCRRRGIQTVVRRGVQPTCLGQLLLPGSVTTTDSRAKAAKTRRRPPSAIPLRPGARPRAGRSAKGFSCSGTCPTSSWPAMQRHNLAQLQMHNPGKHQLPPATATRPGPISRPRLGELSKRRYSRVERLHTPGASSTPSDCTCASV